MKLQRKHYKILTAAVLLALAAVYFFLDPSTNLYFPKCTFYMITGLKCPGCGSQRALHALLHGDMLAAFRLNMWVPVGFVYVVLVFISMFFGNPEGRFSRFITSYHLLSLFLFVTLFWFIFRNVFGF